MLVKFSTIRKYMRTHDVINVREPTDRIVKRSMLMTITFAVNTRLTNMQIDCSQLSMQEWRELTAAHRYVRYHHMFPPNLLQLSEMLWDL